jgi:predicted nucleic acid-binding Zn finger protein
MGERSSLVYIIIAKIEVGTFIVIDKNNLFLMRIGFCVCIIEVSSIRGNREYGLLAVIVIKSKVASKIIIGGI